MALHEQVEIWWLIPLALALVVISYLHAYFVTHQQLRHFPAPFPAQFSNLWLLSVCRRGARYSIMDRVHRELGKVVRIQPDHISIADDSAIPIIYGHGNGFLKA